MRIVSVAAPSISMSPSTAMNPVTPEPPAVKVASNVTGPVISAPPDGSRSSWKMTVPPLLGKMTVTVVPPPLSASLTAVARLHGVAKVSQKPAAGAALSMPFG